MVLIILACKGGIKLPEVFVKLGGWIIEESCRKGADCRKKTRTIHTTNQGDESSWLNHIVQGASQNMWRTLIPASEIYLDKSRKCMAESSWAEAKSKIVFWASRMLWPLNRKRRSLSLFPYVKAMERVQIKQFQACSPPHFGSIG